MQKPLFIKSILRMKAFNYFLFTFLLFFTSCSTDDDCWNVDLLPENFYIELIDSEGNNLLLNGTYDPAFVKVIVNDVIVGTAQTNLNEGLVVINESNAESWNGLPYHILLSPSETDEMFIEYSVENKECGKVYTAQKVIYNGQERGILYYNGNQKINIIKG